MKEIRKIIAAYDALDHSAERVALASVVEVEASSYRRIGARMLVRESGPWVGGISGGCLEGDALKRSRKAIFSGKAGRVVYDTMEDDAHQIGVGLGCNGRVGVLFTPIDPADPDNEIEQLKRITAAEAPAVLLKVIETPGVDSELLGEMALLPPGVHVPDFAGLERSTLEDCVGEVLDRRRSVVYSLPAGEGEVRLLVEFIRPETRLIIVGDNYDVGAMLGIARELGWVTCLVGRKKKMTREMFALAGTVVDYEEAHTLPVNNYTAVLLMSHDFNHDRRMLTVFAPRRPAYLGMLGPRKRFLKMRDELAEMDLEGLPFLHAPTGLEIGAESPNEIALSIAAEVLAVLRGKPGGSLRLKEGSIHDRD
jgi:xanthine/CO dehydrogenase XdhC/CoxF family maturation factor